MPVAVAMADGRVTGVLDGVAADALVRAQAGTLKEKHRLAAFVAHVVATAARHASTAALPEASVQYGLGGSQRLRPLTYDAAQAALATLVAGYRAGLARPLPFFPAASLAHANARKKDDVAVALIADYHGPGTRARAMSFLTIGINGGMILGGSFTGFMAEHHGWRSGFWVLGLGGIALALLGRSAMPAAPAPSRIATPSFVPSPRGSFVAAVKYLARVPSYLVLLTESMLSGFGMWMFFSWLPLYFRDTYSMSLSSAGFAGTFMLQISVMLGIFVGGWISDKVSANAPHRRMLLYGIFYLVGAPFLLLFLGRPAFPVVAAGIAAFSFLRGLGQANDNPTQCEVVPPQFRATGVGIMNAVSTAAGGCGVLVAGYLKRAVGLDTIFASVSGIFLLAGLVLLLGYRFFMRTDIARAQSAA